MRMLGIFVLAAVGWLAFPVGTSAIEFTRSSGVLTVQPAQQENEAMAAYNVVLDRRLGTDELDTLSHRIRRAAPKAQLVLVSFFLRGMRPEQDPWATTYFTSKLGGFVVRINEVNATTNQPDKDLRLAGQ